MKWMSPTWLWGLLLLPLIYLFFLYQEKKKQENLSKFASRPLWPVIVPELALYQRIRKARVLLLVFSLIMISLARPQWGAHEETVKISGLDVLLVLDVSRSMDTEDVIPSRIQKAKHVVRSLLQRLEGDRVGVVAFAGSSYVACPLTTDLSYLADTVQILGPKMIQNQGTDIGTALDTAQKALERGGEEPENKAESKVPSHVIILISDGEDHEARALQVAAKIKESNVKLYILGIGTEKGGPIPLKDENGNPQGYKKDQTGQTVVSTFHPKELMEIARVSDGKYWNVTTAESEVDELLQDLGALARGDLTAHRFLVYEDRFQIPLALAIFLLLLEMSLPARKILPVIVFLLFIPVAQADDGFLKKSAPLDAYVENQKGIKAYKEGRIEEAQQSFGAAQARDPTRPELEFNQGVVQLQQGALDPAIEAFKNAARGASEKKDSTLYGKSLYNLGSALTKKGDTQGAIRSYIDAINSAVESKNVTLEEESRKNLQLLLNETNKHKQEKEEKKNQESKEQKSQESKESKESKKDPKQQDKDSRQDQKNEDKGKSESKEKEKEKEKEKSDQDRQQKDSKDKPDPRYQENSKESRKQPFQSKKMSPEDADRVMDELRNRERELQEKLQKQNAKPQIVQKDW